MLVGTVVGVLVHGSTVEIPCDTPVVHLPVLKLHPSAFLKHAFRFEKVPYQGQPLPPPQAR